MKVSCLALNSIGIHSWFALSFLAFQTNTVPIAFQTLSSSLPNHQWQSKEQLYYKSVYRITAAEIIDLRAGLTALLKLYTVTVWHFRVYPWASHRITF